MKTRKTDWRVRAADPKDDKRKYRAADWIVDMGPEGGRSGGEVVACGTPEEIVRQGVGFTAEFLSKELS